MAALNRLEVAQLKKIQEDPAWDVIIRLLDKRLTDIKNKPIAGENAFQELKQLHKAEGGVEELKRFFDDIERRVFDED